MLNDLAEAIRRRTEKKPNRHAIVYSQSPLLSAITCEKRVSHVVATNSSSFCELRHSGFSALCLWQILVVVVLVGPCPVRLLLCFSAGWRSASGWGICVSPFAVRVCFCFEMITSYQLSPQQICFTHKLEPVTSRLCGLVVAFFCVFLFASGSLFFGFCSLFCSLERDEAFGLCIGPLPVYFCGHYSIGSCVNSIINLICNRLG